MTALMLGWLGSILLIVAMLVSAATSMATAANASYREPGSSATTTAAATFYDDVPNLALATVGEGGQSSAVVRGAAVTAGASLASSGEPSAPRTASGAESAAQGARLREHLRLSERYGAGGVRELPDGRIRYYGELRPANKPGEMAGLRVTREWDPATGNYRTRMETLDHSGRVRQVHPYQPYSEYHYMSDEFGNYVGRR